MSIRHSHLFYTVEIERHLREFFFDSILLPLNSVLSNSSLWDEEAIHTSMAIKSKVTIFEPEMTYDIHFLPL